MRGMSPAFPSSRPQDDHILGIFLIPEIFSSWYSSWIFRLTNNRASPSWIFVWVFRFCLNADGNASGCERVVISVFSYAMMLLFRYDTISPSSSAYMWQVLGDHTVHILRCLHRPLEGQVKFHKRDRITRILTLLWVMVSLENYGIFTYLVREVWHGGIIDTSPCIPSASSFLLW